MSEKLEDEDDELLPEYDLAELLKSGVQGKYAERYHQGTNLVLLEPEIAEAFPSEAAVNEALRLVMQLTSLSKTAGRSRRRAQG